MKSVNYKGGWHFLKGYFDFSCLQLLVDKLQWSRGGIATVIFDRINLSKNER